MIAKIEEVLKRFDQTVNPLEVLEVFVNTRTLTEFGIGCRDDLGIDKPNAVFQLWGVLYEMKVPKQIII